MELNKYIYGLPESPHQFNSLLDKCLKKIGFQPSPADKCCYTYKVKEGIIIASIHVDDILLTTPTAENRKWFEANMLSIYFELVCQRDNISYLGMNITIPST